MSTKLNSYTKYQKVKYDYVDELPEGWQLLPNIAIFKERIERGHNDEELLSVTIGKGVIRQKDVEIKKDGSNEDKSKYKLIKKGDIAYNKMRMWQGAVGYSEYRGISSPAYVILQPKIKLNHKYFHYMFRTSYYTNYSKRFSYGIVDDQLSLRYTDFKRMYSIVPPIETQNTIVEYLDKKIEETEKFVQNKKYLISLLEEEKSSVIYKFISSGTHKHNEFKDSGIDWLGKIPETWKMRRLFWEVSIQEGPGIMAVDFKNEGVPLLRISGMKDGSADLEGCNFLDPRKVTKKWKHFILNEGDVLISASASTDIVCEVSKEAEGSIPYTGIIRLIPRFNEKKLNKQFLKTFISSKIYNQQVELLKAGSTIQHYGPTHLKKFFIILPSLEEQVDIVDVIERHTRTINKAISKAENEIISIREYQDSLITDLVLGKSSV